MRTGNGRDEPPLVERKVHVAHPCGHVWAEVSRSPGGPGGLAELGGHGFNMIGTTHDQHTTCFEWTDVKDLRDLRDVLDALLTEAEAYGLLGEAPPVPPARAHAPPPEALLMKPIFHMAGMEGPLAPGVHLSRTLNGGVELRCVTADGRVLGTMQVAHECYNDHTLTLAWMWLTDHDPATAAAVGWPEPAPASTAPALTVDAGGNKPPRGRPRTKRPLGLVRGDLAARARPIVPRRPRPGGGAA